MWRCRFRADGLKRLAGILQIIANMPGRGASGSAEQPWWFSMPWRGAGNEGRFRVLFSYVYIQAAAGRDSRPWNKTPRKPSQVQPTRRCMPLARWPAKYPRIGQIARIGREWKASLMSAGNPNALPMTRGRTVIVTFLSQLVSRATIGEVAVVHDGGLPFKQRTRFR